MNSVIHPINSLGQKDSVMCLNPLNLNGCVLSLPNTYIDISEDKWYDASPYKNSGDINGAIREPDMRGLKFDGAGGGDYIRIPAADSLNTSSKTSAFVWVKGEEQGTTVFSKYDYTKQKRSWSVMSDGSAPNKKMRIIVTDDGAWNVGHKKQYASSVDVFDNTYHLAGFTFNSGVLKLYIDGVEDTNPTKIYDDAITSIYSSDVDVMVGSSLNNNVPAATFTGYIDQPDIKSMVRSDTEILAYYNLIRRYYQ